MKKKKQVLVIFEKPYPKERVIYLDRFVSTLDKSSVERVILSNKAIETTDTHYKLIGLGFPYCGKQGDPIFEKLKGCMFDEVLIEGGVLLTKYAEWFIKSRMIEPKEFTEFEL